MDTPERVAWALDVMTELCFSAASVPLLTNSSPIPFSMNMKKRIRNLHPLIPSIQTQKIKMFVGNKQEEAGGKTRSTNKAVRAITSSPESLELIAITMDARVLKWK